MCICGYNDKIGEGLKILVEGMAEALMEKTAIKSVNDVLDRELLELQSMIDTLGKAKGEALPEMFIGLNLLAKALFGQVQKDLFNQQSEDLEIECKKTGDKFINLLLRTELHSVNVLKSKAAQDSAQVFGEELSKWVLENLEYQVHEKI